MRVVHCKKEPYDVYIGRPTIWGNPFVIGKDGDRNEVIEKFENYARHNKVLTYNLYMLKKDCVLGCWCYPNRCHGDIIIKLWKELHNE